jgi:SNF2 family DNA or RNA helicase
MDSSSSSEGAQTPAQGGAWWKKQLSVLDEELAIGDTDIAERRFPPADPPPALKCTLLPFQRESLYWMTQQERSSFRGGILADEVRGGGAAGAA